MPLHRIECSYCSWEDICPLPIFGSYPPDKLSQARTLLANWRKRSSCKLKELPSLIGVLQFACRVISPGRIFLRRMISLTSGVKQPYHFVKLNSGFYKDLAMWEGFLKHWNGISLFLESEHTPSPSLHLFMDASGSIGFGGYLAGRWFQGRWLLEQHLDKKSGISIEWQELYPIYLACRLWGSQWTTKRIVFFCDNESVVQILNCKTLKSPKIMDLLRPIFLCTLDYNFTFTAKHVRRVDNGIADSLSRFQMDRFRQLAPLASPLPCVIPPSMVLSFSKGTMSTRLLIIPGRLQLNKHIQQVSNGLFRSASPMVS